ncbi:MAG TPA: 30S ribosomal protein S16 [Patescibacteria group bacterium]|nr:30S ribosomal protein S16 [Patescibacteria group bacterium]
MIAIRLSRFGRKKAPFYRIVAVDSRKKTTGQVLEILGTWNPFKKVLNVKKDEVSKWVKKGAKISSTVEKLLEK